MDKLVGLVNGYFLKEREARFKPKNSFQRAFQKLKKFHEMRLNRINGTFTQ